MATGYRADDDGIATMDIGMHEPIRFVSVNIRTGRALDGVNRWARRRDMLFDLLRELRPDVLGVQEALRFQADELAEALAGYAIAGRGRRKDGGGEHVPVLWNSSRIDVERSGDFWLAPTPDVPGVVGWDAQLPRVCTWAVLRPSGAGQQFVVLNTHFDHRGRLARIRAAELVSSRISEMGGVPAVLLGDLNAGEDTEVLAQLRSAGLRDSFRVVHPDAPAGTFHGFEGVSSGRKIDYVLCDAGWHVHDAAIDRSSRDGRFPSDHFPVVADLVLHPQTMAE